MIRAVVFDLDKTLLDRDTSFHQFACGQYDRFCNELSAVPKDLYVSRLINLDNWGYAPKQKVYPELVRRFELPSALSQALLDDYEMYYPKSTVSFPDLEGILESLKDMGLILAIITNGRTVLQNLKVDVLGIRRYFDYICISESVGISKPNPRIFLHTTHEIHCAPEDCIYVGDHPTNDVRAAKAVGMRAIWKRSHAWEEPEEADAVIDHLSDLSGVVRQYQ